MFPPPLYCGLESNNIDQTNQNNKIFQNLKNQDIEVNIYKKECMYLKRGKCKAGIHCKYSHEINLNDINLKEITEAGIYNKYNKPCWYEKVGKCKKGHQCQYRHQICEFYQNMGCKYGESCRNIHIRKIKTNTPNSYDDKHYSNQYEESVTQNYNVENLQNYKEIPNQYKGSYFYQARTYSQRNHNEEQIYQTKYLNDEIYDDQINNNLNYLPNSTPNLHQAWTYTQKNHNEVQNYQIQHLNDEIYGDQINNLNYQQNSTPSYPSNSPRL